MPDENVRPLFFVHVMKTAGASLRHQVRSRLDDEQVYPSPTFDDMFHANRDVATLLELPDDRHRGIQAYMGHFPYVAAELLGRPVLTLSLLREPVARVVSMLRHLRHRIEGHQESSFDEIYDDPVLSVMYLRNHQAKVFAFTAVDKEIGHTVALEIDDQRLRIARQHIDRVDILGLTETYDLTLREVADRFGWELGAPSRRNVSPPGDEISPALLRRIARDNEADIELYEYAKRRCRTA